MTDLFSSPVLRVEQPRKVLQKQVQYNFFDSKGTLLAVAAETTVRSRRKAVRAALPGAVLFGQQILLVSTPDDEPVLVIDKQEEGRLTLVRRPDGEDGTPGDPIGSIRAHRTTRHYALLDAEGNRVGELTGDLGLRKFAVTDAARKHVAQVNKKWAGLAAEVLTTADRYHVEISGPVGEALRTLIVVSAVVLDLTLHESKDVV